MTSREAPHHNNSTCYTEYRCRQLECVERYNARNMERIRARKAGTWIQLIDAEPVRQHLLQLHAAGIRPGWIAATTGLSIQTLRDFVQPHPNRNRGRKQRTSPETAAKILAVTEENHLRGRVDGLGTRRRIQALVRVGWPMNHIAAHAGISQAYISVLMRRDVIFGSTAKAVADTYDHISKRNPPANISAAQVKRARNWAAAEGWPPPKYWAKFPDAIDDPHFTPEYGMTKPELRAEEARWLVTTAGVPRNEVAARLGMTFGEVDDALAYTAAA
ncbi:hypothetical protein OG594_08735 [Streptomyces sp. NBC_01214]|uniref:hypothetical protein n=1 Tax=Streptomyces sp. NBC_01214 TaxID=2903777 RepID=UPI002250C370|nr:hypothetical protein [Streptomyces sp. NBC_01214]MCX4801735.1 hypothetical protein [Streptomyces sp. NBC_01214]